MDSQRRTFILLAMLGIITISCAIGSAGTEVPTIVQPCVPDLAESWSPVRVVSTDSTPEGGSASTIELRLPSLGMDSSTLNELQGQFVVEFKGFSKSSQLFSAKGFLQLIPNDSVRFYIRDEAGVRVAGLDVLVPFRGALVFDNQQQIDELGLRGRRRVTIYAQQGVPDSSLVIVAGAAYGDSHGGVMLYLLRASVDSFYGVWIRNDGAFSTEDSRGYFCGTRTLDRRPFE